MLQAVMLYAFVQQYHARQLLLTSVALVLCKDEDGTIFIYVC